LKKVEKSEGFAVLCDIRHVEIAFFRYNLWKRWPEKWPENYSSI